MRLPKLAKFGKWFILIQMVIACSIVYGQEKNKKAVVIKSDPPGAMVHFEGENGFVGITPLKLRTSLKGNYKITILKNGYEKSKTSYYFTGNEGGSMKIKLSPKTQFKAGLRSLVFPGWGQVYSERKTTGILLSIIQAGTGIVTYLAHSDYTRAYDNYQNAFNDYEKNKSQEMDEQYLTIFKNKYKKAEDAFNKREKWLYIMGGLWLYNLLDSILFFPSFEEGLMNNSVPLISANINNESVMLNLTMPF